jgi:hypothetical protein
MYCAQCGTQLQESQKFCNRCGYAVGGPAQPPANPAPAAYRAAPPPAAPYFASPNRSRVACHVRTLGILWIVVSAMRLLPALGLLAFSHMGRMDFPFMPSQFRWLMMPMMGAFGVFLSATALVGLAAGWGLLDRRPWARVFAIVVGCLSLLSFPFGTALGIYTLWVLAGAGADMEYERLARVQ